MEQFFDTDFESKKICYDRALRDVITSIFVVITSCGLPSCRGQPSELNAVVPRGRLMEVFLAVTNRSLS